MSPNLKKDQIRKLVEKIQFRMKGDRPASATAQAKVPLKQKEDLQQLQKPAPSSGSQFPAFKSGSALPSVQDFGKENKTVKFEDEFEQEDEYDEEEGSDFDANELLDMTDYKNKRGIPSPAEIANIKPSTANAKSVFPPPA